MLRIPLALLMIVIAAQLFLVRGWLASVMCGVVLIVGAWLIESRIEDKDDDDTV